MCEVRAGWWARPGGSTVGVKELKHAIHEEVPLQPKRFLKLGLVYQPCTAGGSDALMRGAPPRDTGRGLPPSARPTTQGRWREPERPVASTVVIATCANHLEELIQLLNLPIQRLGVVGWGGVGWGGVGGWHPSGRNRHRGDPLAAGAHAHCSHATTQRVRAPHSYLRPIEV